MGIEHFEGKRQGNVVALRTNEMRMVTEFRCLSTYCGKVTKERITDRESDGNVKEKMC